MSKSSCAWTARAEEILRTRLLRFPGPALLAAIALAAGAAGAQDYPNRPIRLIIPYGTGGITDITARIVAPRIADTLGQQVVVENRAGGAAVPGFDLVAKARPDGYIAVLATTALAANPILFRKLPYDAEKDFAPVSLVATAPTVLVVHPSVPAHSVKELIALAKSKPGALNYGSAGNGTDNHLTTEVFKHATGIDVLHIPYKGGGAAMTDLVGGQVAFVFGTIPSAHPYITSGRLRALAVSSLKRNSSLPAVPTVSEAALPGFNLNAWLGIFVPAGTPANVIDRLHAATVTALQRPEVSERLISLGLEPVGSTPAQLGTHLKSEMARWAKLAREVKFEVVD